MNYKSVYENWINDEYFDSETKKELLSIKDNEKEIEERFYKDLDFGTGGLRGIIGAGINRINIYTVSKATQGLADYILNQKEYKKEKGVAIGYDSRFMSKEFAEITALVLNGNGIKTYLFDELRPTPMVSFAIRELGCIAGVVITASHNPPEYNGYKIYGEDGGQVPFPKDVEIIGYVNNVKDFKAIKKLDKEEAIKQNLFNIIGKEIDEKYDENVLNQLINKDMIKTFSDLKIVYTPIHGTGNKPVRRILEKAGFKNVNIVKEQELPDCKFSTVDYPNPEDPNAFKLALKLAEEIDADIIVGTDPDADRVGAVVKNNKGEYIILSGNMMGVLLTDYILSQKQQKGTLSSKGAIISTVVSSNMTEKIAKNYNVDYFNVLTGFKFIGEKIKQFEQTGRNEYIFGFEESYGCLAGTYARDKDAVVATMLICELAGFYKNKGLTLYEGLQEIYKKYGYFKEDIKSITLKGIDGIKDMEKIMTYLRESTPKAVNGKDLIEVRDYKVGKIKNLPNNTVLDTDLPKSNVLYFTLSDKSWFCVRPSGTEPKIKIYFGVEESTESEANIKLDSLMKNVMDMIENILK
ncbi:phospho-sugar mutase [[Clostridium] colinum]|uniref:phospho-sugar mutase n=1 Tax=[Clostridium] colinum TaxID=36835 RepID=UPI002023C92B|nr:phospho-sugar mutase [[Clostridium] colinum]